MQGCDDATVRCNGRKLKFHSIKTHYDNTHETANCACRAVLLVGSTCTFLVLLTGDMCTTSCMHLHHLSWHALIYSFAASTCCSRSNIEKQFCVHVLDHGHERQQRRVSSSDVRARVCHGAECHSISAPGHDQHHGDIHGGGTLWPWSATRSLRDWLWTTSIARSKERP